MPGKDNKNAQTHGGGAALEKIRFNAPFTGLAEAREIEVMDEYDHKGPGAVILRNAIRLQVVSDLYYDAIKKAAQDNDPEALQTALNTWGSVTNSAIRAMDLVRRALKKDQAIDGWQFETNFLKD